MRCVIWWSSLTLLLALGSTAARADPVIATGAAGQAIVIAGFDTVGSAFAPAAAPFGPLTAAAPRSVDGLALDRAGTATAVVAGGAPLQSLVAPPNGPFGAPTAISAGAVGQARLAVDEDGAAIVAWIAYGPAGQRLTVALRPAGGAFGRQMDLGAVNSIDGVAVDPDGTGHVLVSRSDTPVVLVSVAPTDPRPRSLPLAGSAGSGLTRSADGRLLAVMHADVAVGLISQLVSAGGRSAASPVVVAGPQAGYPNTVGASLAPSGSAVVAWTANDNTNQPVRVSVAEGNAATGYARPRDFPREGYLSSVAIAANARGDTALVWTAPGYRPRAVMRPAGGAIGQPIVISPRDSDAATVAMLPDGTALIAHTERTGRTQRQVVTRLTAAGVGSTQALAERTSLIQARARARCRAARGSVIKDNAYAVYRRTARSGVMEVCSKITGTTAQRVDTAGDFLNTVRLAGHLTAVAVLTGETDGPDAYANPTVLVTDTATGRPLDPLREDFSETDAVGDLVLAPDGAYAVIVCATGTDVFGVRSPTRLARRECSRPGHVTSVVVVDRPGPWTGRVVARGRSIDPRSLRLRGRRVTWRAAGRTRSTTLRAVRLPG